ncbi:MAG: DUF1192 domain-containing protein [Alphaproteobacteria bacterium]
MFDDDLPKPKTFEFPRNLENMSISDLNDYISALREEIQRVEVDIDRKKKSQESAHSVFK